MAYDDALANRIRGILGSRDDVREQKMFGGIAFMVRGHMACGVIRDDLMIRIPAGEHEAALEEPHVRTMDFTHRTMPGFLYVGADGIATDAGLGSWVARAVAYAESRPPK
ncbi:MAG: TfoX/Sxy family protein [Chloroflexota bacterium]|jgi:TfoX/Sxy family transcriptional regulator of competence genes|nr:TfoX/Sxy family protein [Chloroflexota bacterium]MDH5242992.1 TfoX/Sxy family protein [Chloroflexota bacterium]